MPALPSIIISSVQKLIGMKIAVVSPETELQAREYLASIRKELKAFKASIVEVKKPFKKEIDEIDTASKPWIEKLQQKDQETEQAILAYLRKVREETEKRNQKELEKYEKKVATVEAKAIANGKPMPIVLPPAMVSAPQKTVTLDTSKQTTMKIRKWRISGVSDPAVLTRADEIGKSIPDDLFVLDTAKVTKIIKAGGIIQGIEGYFDETLSIR